MIRTFLRLINPWAEIRRLREHRDKLRKIVTDGMVSLGRLARELDEAHEMLAHITELHERFELDPYITGPNQSIELN